MKRTAFLVLIFVICLLYSFNVFSASSKQFTIIINSS